MRYWNLNWKLLKHQKNVNYEKCHFHLIICRHLHGNSEAANRSLSIVLVTMAYCLHYVNVNTTKKETSNFQKIWGQKSLLSTLVLCLPLTTVRAIHSKSVMQCHKEEILSRIGNCQSTIFQQNLSLKHELGNDHALWWKKGKPLYFKGISKKYCLNVNLKKKKLT